MSEVVLYGRPGCCLCDDARDLLERLRERIGFELHERNIESDARLHRAYLERIPVITIDGREAFELILREAEVERALTDAQRTKRP